MNRRDRTQMEGGLVALAVLAFGWPAAAQPAGRDPAQAPEGHYELDPRFATLAARMKQFGGLARFTLRFDRLEGSFRYDPANWTTTKVAVRVDPSSVRVNPPGFAKTVRGPRYLNVQKYPTIVFVSTAATGAAGKGQVTGDLTFMGRTRPVTLDVQFAGFEPEAAGRGTRMGFSGKGRIRRSDFGLKVPLNAVSNDVDLAFEVEFVRK